MVKIGILGDIGSGKSFVANSFGYPVFNADKIVAELYQNDKLIFSKLKKILPKYFPKFPVSKKKVLDAIFDDERNLKKIVKIVHEEVRKKLNIFLKQNSSKRIVILDIPLLLENKINNKQDILVFVQSQKTDVLKRLKKRKNYNRKLLSIFKKIQLPLDLKKKKSKYIIKNDFTKKKIFKEIKYILKDINK